MKLAIVFAGLTLLSSIPAAAQTPPTAPQSPPSPAAVAHARHLMDVMHMDKMMAQMGPAMTKPMFDRMAQKMPAAQQKKMAVMQSVTWDEMRALMPKLMDAMVQIYATNLTEQELADTDQFYSSASGQAVLAKTPQLTQQLIPVMMNEMPALMHRVYDRYCAEATCTPQERAAFTKSVDVMLPTPAN